jgi:glycosyltransferase involved in cell wall biosynthesis
MSQIAIGVPMFSREQALQELLESVPEYVSTVYIADNGEKDHRELYDQEYPFDIDVEHLPYDCGIGPCRHNIAERVTEPYLWVGDSDMEFSSPDNLLRLQEILEANPDLGGVSGWLNEHNRIRSGARNLVELNNTIIKTVPDEPDVTPDPYPHARFDFIPQAGLFRTTVFRDYTYDPEIYNSEHLDFFYGHHKTTHWEFASTPSVVIKHKRNIDPEYRESQRGKNHVDFDVMEEKWGFNSAHPGPRSDWSNTRERSPGEQAFDLFRSVTPASVWVPVRNLARKGGLG